MRRFLCALCTFFFSSVLCAYPFEGFYVGLQGNFGDFSARRIEDADWTGGTSTTKNSISTLQGPIGVLGGYGLTCSRFYFGVQNRWLFATRSINDKTEGEFGGISYWDKDKLRKFWETALDFNIGYVVDCRSLFYLIGSANLAHFSVMQKYKTTAMDAEVSTSDGKLKWGGTGGVGASFTLPYHMELRCETLFTFFQKIKVQEIHPEALDDLILYPRSILGSLTLLYRF